MLGSDDDRFWLDCSVMYVQSKRTDGPPHSYQTYYVHWVNVTLTHMMMFSTCSSLKVVPVGMSRGVKKLMQERFPNMSKFEDISELMIK